MLSHLEISALSDAGVKVLFFDIWATIVTLQSFVRPDVPERSSLGSREKNRIRRAVRSMDGARPAQVGCFYGRVRNELFRRQLRVMPVSGDA